MKDKAAPDRWAQTREITIPRASNRDGDAWVCVNGRSFQIPRGRKWQVPLPVAEVLERREKARESADAFRARQK